MELKRGDIHFTFKLENKKEWRRGQDVCQEFIDEVKEAVPKTHRKYDNQTNIWTVDNKYLDKVVELKKKYFEDENQMGLFG